MTRGGSSSTISGGEGEGGGGSFKCCAGMRSLVDMN